jgi:hypothetical protein
MKHVEVEVKYSLPDPETLVRRLAELDAVPLGEDRQVDTYFNAPHRDFLAGEIVSEWLRLRTETGDHTAERNSINFKRWLPLGAAEATHARRRGDHRRPGPYLSGLGAGARPRLPPARAGRTALTNGTLAGCSRALRRAC